MQKTKQFTGIVVGIAAVLALKFYGKAQKHDDILGDLTASCKGDQACLGALDSHFDGCFSTPAARGDATALHSCLNDKVGTPLFGTVTAH